MGIVLVTLCAARLAGVPQATIRSTGRLTSSDARAGNCSARPWAKRYSKRVTFSLDITQVPQPVPQSLKRRPGLVRENTDFPQAARRLRARRERPERCRTTEHRDELAPPHGAYPKAKDHGLKYSRSHWLSDVQRNKNGVL
jgi:hypothetical protein